VEIPAYVAAALTALWGVAHAVPTRQVLAGFAPITADNRRVLKQEWLAEDRGQPRLTGRC
jgi:citrate synthase